MEKRLNGKMSASEIERIYKLYWAAILKRVRAIDFFELLEDFDNYEKERTSFILPQLGYLVANKYKVKNAKNYVENIKEHQVDPSNI